MNTSKQTKKLILSALFAALSCVSAVTLHFHFPLSPHGCITVSDCFFIMAGLLLGYGYGGISAGIGALLGDIILGHIEYAIPSFVFKMSVALMACLVCNALSKKQKSFKTLHLIIAGLAGEAISVIGYFVYDGILYGNINAAISTLPANLIQAAIGITLSTIIIKILHNFKITDQLI